MKKFTVEFTLEGHRHQAEVSVIEESNNTQYTVWPLDEPLQQEFGAQVFHELKPGDLQTAFPFTETEGQHYTDALKKAIRHHLDR